MKDLMSLYLLSRDYVKYVTPYLGKHTGYQLSLIALKRFHIAKMPIKNDLKILFRSHIYYNSYIWISYFTWSSYFSICF